MVYNFEHSHDLRQRDVDKDKEHKTLEEVARCEGMMQLCQKMKKLLLSGTNA